MRQRRLVAALLAAAAAALPVGISASGAAAPFGGDAAPKVQPGGAVVVPATGTRCTLNFLFQGSDGKRYMATAGICALAGRQDDHFVEEAWKAGEGPEAQDAGGKRIGEFAYAILDATVMDFALIRLDPGVDASPVVAHFGGPSGINADLVAAPATIQYYGQGGAPGGVPAPGVMPARSGKALDLSEPGYVYAEAVTGFGDAGAPVLTEDGRALGALVGGAVFSDTLNDVFSDNTPKPSTQAGLAAVTRLNPRLAGATSITRVTYTLVTAG